MVVVVVMLLLLLLAMMLLVGDCGGFFFATSSQQTRWTPFHSCSILQRTLDCDPSFGFSLLDPFIERLG